MRLTQAQVRQLADVPEETFRVWRGALPPLGRRSGRGAHFTLGDVVAVAAIRSLVSAFGVKIHNLADVSPELFDACADATLPGRAPALLIVSGGRAWVAAAVGPLSEIEAAAVVVALQPIVERVRAQLLRGPADVQPQLPLGLTVLPTGKRA